MSKMGLPHLDMSSIHAHGTMPPCQYVFTERTYLHQIYEESFVLCLVAAFLLDLPPLVPADVEQLPLLVSQEFLRQLQRRDVHVSKRDY